MFYSLITRVSRPDSAPQGLLQNPRDPTQGKVWDVTRTPQQMLSAKMTPHISDNSIETKALQSVLCAGKRSWGPVGLKLDNWHITVSKRKNADKVLSSQSLQQNYRARYNSDSHQASKMCLSLFLF